MAVQFGLEKVGKRQFSFQYYLLSPPKRLPNSLLKLVMIFYLEHASALLKSGRFNQPPNEPPPEIRV